MGPGSSYKWSYGAPKKMALELGNWAYFTLVTSGVCMDFFPQTARWRRNRNLPGRRRALRCGATSMDLLSACEVPLVEGGWINRSILNQIVLHP